VALVTGKALFRWQSEKRRFRLESVHPGHAVAEVREATGFDYDAADAHETPDPAAPELELLRGPVARELAGDYPEFVRRVWS
jgi:glutaconate CoA-transferase subunit B